MKILKSFIFPILLTFFCFSHSYAMGLFQKKLNKRHSRRLPSRDSSQRALDASKLSNASRSSKLSGRRVLITLSEDDSNKIVSILAGIETGSTNELIIFLRELNLGEQNDTIVVYKNVVINLIKAQDFNDLRSIYLDAVSLNIQFIKELFESEIKISVSVVNLNVAPRRGDVSRRVWKGLFQKNTEDSLEVPLSVILAFDIFGGLHFTSEDFWDNSVSFSEDFWNGIFYIFEKLKEGNFHEINTNKLSKSNDYLEFLQVNLGYVVNLFVESLKCKTDEEDFDKDISKFLRFLEKNNRAINYNDDVKFVPIFEKFVNLLNEKCSQEEKEKILKQCLKKLSPEIIINFNEIKSSPDVLLNSKCLNKISLTFLIPFLIENQNLKKLNLDNNNLSELPDNIGQLTGLLSLNLSNNDLRELPKSIGQLTNLIVLRLSNNDWIEFPDNIGQLTSLRWLYLKNNNLSKLPDNIGQLTNLRQLNLKNNNLSKLPEIIGQLTGLLFLNLSNNNLREFPDNIGQLTSLKWLYLKNNNLSEFPDNIAQLTHLTVLNLSNNKLTELPESIWKLTGLRFLYLYNNKLRELPESIWKLTQLFSFNLDDNNLSMLPDSIGQLTSLEYLNLDNNNLSELPDNIGRLTNLIHLYLKNNNLSELPESFFGLTQIRRLVLRGNNLPESILNRLRERESLQVIY